MIGQKRFTEHSDVRELKDGEALGIGQALGFDLVVHHTPGHTGGSVTFRLPRGTDPAQQNPDVLFTGDLLFAGSVGRTDLPGRDPRIAGPSRPPAPGRHRRTRRPRTTDHRRPRTRIEPAPERAQERPSTPGPPLGRV